eukprot:scaffold6918_cov380-Prasinococcus_capsulatus_cf.AAC.14
MHIDGIMRTMHMRPPARGRLSILEYIIWEAPRADFGNGAPPPKLSERSRYRTVGRTCGGSTWAVKIGADLDWPAGTCAPRPAPDGGRRHPLRSRVDHPSPGLQGNARRPRDARDRTGAALATQSPLPGWAARGDATRAR